MKYVALFASISSAWHSSRHHLRLRSAYLSRTKQFRNLKLSRLFTWCEMRSSDWTQSCKVTKASSLKWKSSTLHSWRESAMNGVHGSTNFRRNLKIISKGLETAKQSKLTLLCKLPSNLKWRVSHLFAVVRVNRAFKGRNHRRSSLGLYKILMPRSSIWIWTQ
jgi:hypothetical protein